MHSIALSNVILSYFSLVMDVVCILLSLSVTVMDVESGVEKYSITKPRTRCMCFSPLGSYLALWEPYIGWCTTVCW